MNRLQQLRFIRSRIKFLKREVKKQEALEIKIDPEKKPKVKINVEPGEVDEH